MKYFHFGLFIYLHDFHRIKLTVSPEVPPHHALNSAAIITAISSLTGSEDYRVVDAKCTT